MLKRIVGVITVRDGMAVQSFHYPQLSALGQSVHLADNLCRWAVDEIMVLDIRRSKQGLGPDLDLLRTISSSRVNTPLIYGGGINTAEDAVAVVHSGADRVVLDTILHRNSSEISTISGRIGSQAVIASFPVRLQKDGSLAFYNHVEDRDVPLSERVLDILRRDLVSEILLIDRKRGSSWHL